MTESKVRVLVVDDERPIRRFLRTSLEVHGYDIFEAADGLDALAAVVNHRPDLVILDLGLPELDGVEVTRRLREWTQIPIIVLSVRDEEADKIAGEIAIPELRAFYLLEAYAASQPLPAVLRGWPIYFYTRTEIRIEK